MAEKREKGLRHDHKGWSLFEDVKGSTLHLVDSRAQKNVEYLLKNADNKEDLATIRPVALLSLGISGS